MLNDISLVTVCRNSQATISRCLDSVYSDLSKGNQYIIVDGESTDGTIDIVNKHLINKRFNVEIYSRPPKGVYDALNYAISRCNGEYIMIVHSNDLLMENTINFYEKALQENPDIDIFYSDIIFRDTKCNITNKLSSDKDPYEKKLKRMSIAHSSMLIKRELLSNRPYLTEYKIAADYEMMKYFIESNRKFKYLATTSHIITDIGISSKNLVKSSIEVFLINIEYDGINPRQILYQIPIILVNQLKILLRYFPIVYCALKKMFRKAIKLLTVI